MSIKVAKNDFTRKWMILTPLQKMPNNVGNLGKIIVLTGFEWLPKVQKIAKSGHTGPGAHLMNETRCHWCAV